MTDGFALREGAVISWRAATVGALLAFALALGLWQGLDRAGASALADAPGALPLARQDELSATLGAAMRGYRVSASAAGLLRTSNPAQHVDALFGREVELHAGATTVAFSLRQAGYAGALRDVAAVAPRMSANRVRYPHPGVIEWYVNGPLGLEQGFTLTRAPSGPAGGPLTLVLTLAGDARATVLPGGGEVVFSHPGGPSLRYGQLSASDARGRRLTSRMRLQGGRLLIQVDGRGARYPITIDPLVQEGITKVPAPPEESGKGQYGFAVALSADGQTALVGAPNDSNRLGAAWVLTHANGSWAVQQRLAPTGEAGGACEGEEGDQECGFGHSVAISADGEMAVVGAPRAGAQKGAAWIYVREGSGWRLAQVLTGAELPPEEPLGREARFGRSVAISADGNTILVAAPNDKGGAGSVWTFVHTESGWVKFGPAIALGGEETGPFGHFGVSVALSSEGGTALIGAPSDEHRIGTAWVFVRGSGGWTMQGRHLRGEGESGEGSFGFSVALSADGNTALVGARSDSGLDGAAWVFTRSGGEWSEQARLTDGQGEGRFGQSVALSADGNRALVGAPHETGLLLGTPIPAMGAAWSFTRSGTNWSHPGEKLTGAGETEKGWFGSGAALSADGKSALVGAPNDNAGRGSLWSFREREELPEVTEVTPSAGPASGGTTVTIAGKRLQGASVVKFGSFSAVPIDVAEESVTVLAPRVPASVAEAGAVNVTVVTPQGESPVAETAKFTYLPLPEVTRILPSQGPTTGGTAVTIVGKHLAEAGAVRFGTLPARSFTVDSDTSITAVTPTEAVGSVPVTVTTPTGTNAEGPSFVFLSEPSGGGSSVTTGSGGVLGFGPHGPGVRCAVGLVSHTISVSHSRAAVRLRWGGAGMCAGRVRLTVHVRSGAHRVQTRTIGTAIFSGRNGRIAVASIRLNALGRSLFATAHGSLRASLTIITQVPGPTQRVSGTVRLRLRSAPKGKR